MLQDLLYSMRIMWRRPAFSVVAILSLTLGIGANMAVFGLVDSLFLKPLPVHRPAELVRLVEENRETSTVREAFRYTTYDELRRGTRLLSDVIVMSDMPGPVRIIERDEESPAFVQLVSDNYFDALGIRASQGRVFHEPAPGMQNDAIAVISDAFWRQHYGANPATIGARLSVNKTEFTIAGIAPPEFRGTSINVAADVWVPFEQMVPVNSDERVRGRWLQIMGRLSPGQNLAGAQAEATSILRRPEPRTGDLRGCHLRPCHDCWRFVPANRTEPPLPGFGIPRSRPAGRRRRLPTTLFRRPPRRTDRTAEVSHRVVAWC